MTEPGACLCLSLSSCKGSTSATAMVTGLHHLKALQTEEVKLLQCNCCLGHDVLVPSDGDSQAWGVHLEGCHDKQLTIVGLQIARVL